MHKNLAGERLLTEIDVARLSHLRGAQRPPALSDMRESKTRQKRQKRNRG